MKVVYSLPDGPTRSDTKVLTIGNFDGVHLGHRTILDETVRQAKKLNTGSAALSFINHPSTVVRQDQSVPSLCTPEHKIRLLGATGVDLLFLIPFTKELSELSADQFLKSFQKKLHFECLVLGEDAAFGKDKKGDRAVVENISKHLGFKAFYLPDCLVEGGRVSSSLIRRCIQDGKLKAASAYLGRPFSIYAKVHKGAGRGKALGIHTANLSVAGLCIPPLGVYAVQVVHDGNVYPAVANLGFAPTFREDRIPILEVHIWEVAIDLYDAYVEIIFHEYIRPEKRFNSADELKTQIAADILSAKHAIL